MVNGRLERREEAIDLALGVPFEACKGWQMAGLDAKKKRLIWPWGGSARRVWRARNFARKALRAWETASLNAYKKRLMWPWGSFCLRGWTFQDPFAKL